MRLVTKSRRNSQSRIGGTRTTKTAREKSRTESLITKSRTTKPLLVLLPLPLLILYGAIWICTSLRTGAVQPQPRLGLLDLAHFKEQFKQENTNKDGEKLFITYRLELDKPYNVTYGVHTRCSVGVVTNKWGRKPINRVELAKPLSDILNVTAFLRTNLKIITMGDSVGMQLHQILEEALQHPNNNNNNNNNNAPTASNGTTNINTDGYRTIYQNAWGTHESVSVSAPVNGEGALAAFRMTGLLLEEGKGKPPPNKGPDLDNAAGGWLPEHVRQILNHKYTMPAVGSSNNGGNDNGNKKASATTTTIKIIESFDAMLFRIPHGWLPASIITRERLEASLRMAQELFGVRTIVIQNLFLNNNVKTMEDLTVMHATNQMIRELVEASWEDPDLPDLLLMDFGGWTDQLNELNARLAGMDTQSNATYGLDRLGCAMFGPSIAMACAKTVKPGSCRCDRNVVSLDGMHWCMETIAGRVMAGFACLLQCSLSTYDDKKSHFGSCQQRCNEQFMSLRKASSLLTITAATRIL